MYDDGRVACTEDGLVIRRYYFPAGDKRIPYRAIRQVRRQRLGSLRWKVHGSGDFVHWFGYDPDRSGLEAALVLFVGRWIRPVVTPDNPDQVVADLAAHGVPVCAGGN